MITWMTTPRMLWRDMTTIATVQCSVVARTPYLHQMCLSLEQRRKRIWRRMMISVYKYLCLMMIITFTAMPIEDVSLGDWWLVFLWLMQHSGQIPFSIINDVNGDYLWKKLLWKRLGQSYAVNISMLIKKVNDSSLMDAASVLLESASINAACRHSSDENY